MNYDALSREELINLLKNSDKENIDLKEKMKQSEAKLKEAYSYIDKLIAKYELKNQNIFKKNYEKFVTKSEKLSDLDIIMNEAEVIVESEKKKVGRKAGGSNFVNDIEVTSTITYDIDYKSCPKCNEALIKIGEDETIKIVKIPARYEAIKIIKPKYACKKKECVSTVHQHISDDVFSHSPLTPSFCADIIINKYFLGVPLDRLSKHLIMNGYSISTQNLSNYVLRAADILNPLFECLKDVLIHSSAKVIYVDETTLKVLDFKDRSKSYIFVYVSSFYQHPIYLYDFNETRKTTQTQEILDGYSGYLVCDNYSGYDK